jgi:ribosomal protein S12 methylthiotransferase accessory factor
VEKVVFSGTHRVRTPERTLEIITPQLELYGITRLADVTGLDTLGVPVVMAVRPLAATLSVAQGKGATLALAKVSAAMECIEFWHAEEAVPLPSLVGVPGADLPLGYEIGDLEQPEGSLLTPYSRLDWIEASSAVNGQAMLAPRAAVQLGRWRDGWEPSLPGTSNGLASGNTRAEALIHALYEVIERDATAALKAVPLTERTYLNLDSVPGYCAALIGGIQAAGAWLEIVVAPSRFGVPCYVAYLWREDFASTAIGAGAHSDPAVALSRAVTEAAQSRLTAIVGSRDDIPPRTYSRPGAAVARPVSPPGARDWGTLTAGYSSLFATDDEEAAWLARRVAAVTDTDPMVVDLCTGEISVLKVLCPGLANAARHGIARSEPAPS